MTSLSESGEARPTAAAPTYPVAVLLSRFPAVTQTFIVRELVEMERQGVAVVLVSLARGGDRLVHPVARPWVDRAIYPRPLGGAVLLENLRVFVRRPWLYLSVLVRLLASTVRRPRKLIAALWIFPTAVWIGRELRDIGVGHVHAHFASHAATAAFVASRVHADPGPDVPYSVTVHGSDLFVDQVGLGLLLGKAAFVRAISDYNRDFLLERLGGSSGPDPDRVGVIHCGVEPARYGRSPVSGEPGVDRPVRALCIGALLPNKGIAYLIEAIALLRGRAFDVECEIIGEGPLRPSLERRIRRAGLGDSVLLPGLCTEEEVARRLAHADLFVLASLVARGGKREGIPVALMEAMATGLPVVATRITGIPELVRHGETGILVEPGDPDALADAIVEILRDRARASAMGEAGRRRVHEHFSIDACVAELVRRILADRTQPTSAAGG